MVNEWQPLVGGALADCGLDKAKTKENLGLRATGNTRYQIMVGN